MDYYECDECGNVWADYEPKACPFCYSADLHPIGCGIPEPEEHPAESDTVSVWTQS